MFYAELTKIFIIIIKCSLVSSNALIIEIADIDESDFSVSDTCATEKSEIKVECYKKRYGVQTYLKDALGKKN